MALAHEEEEEEVDGLFKANRRREGGRERQKGPRPRPHKDKSDNKDDNPKIINGILRGLIVFSI